VCTFVILHRMRADLPLVVGATRDEFYARPTLPPAVERGILAGRDAERGGSWLGVTAGGLFVGLTNQRSFLRPERAARTRGEVVMNALAAGSFDGVCALLHSIDARDYGGFNLLFGDGDRLGVAYAHPEVAPEPKVVLVEPGFHVLPNDRLDAAGWPKVIWARELVEPHATAPWPELVSAMTGALASHRLSSLEEVPQPPPDFPLPRQFLRELSAICIHTPAYGTRSVTLTAIAPGRTLHHLAADGPACVTPLVERSALLYPT
jgi:uncharacterized protein with NRDE domain